MKRRNFFGGALGTTAAVASGLSCAGDHPGEPEKTGAPMRSTTIGTLGGMSLEKLRDTYRYELFDDFLPFVEKYVVDHEYGGFMTSTDHDGTNVSTDKRPYSLGRGIWLFSHLYLNFGREQKWLDIAGKAVEFTMKHAPDGDGLYPNVLSREGDVVRGPGVSIAADCYMGEGLTEFGRAAGDPEYVRLGRETMMKCLRKYDSPDYSDGASPYPGARNLWYWMLFMWYGTNFLMHEDDAELAGIVERCATAILDHHVNPQFDLMNNVINHDLTLSDDPEYSNVAACGHATEALWMLIYEALRRRDREMFSRCAGMFRRHVDVSLDDVYGGVFNDCTDVDGNVWELRKIHWAQEFVLMGSLPVVAHEGHAWARDMFDRQFAYVWDKFPLRQYGFPMWINSGDRWVTFTEHVSRKEIYHHPRHLMLNLRCLDGMIGRGGRIPETFGL